MPYSLFILYCLLLLIIIKLLIFNYSNFIIISALLMKNNALLAMPVYCLYCISINIYYNYWIIFNFRFYLIGFVSGFIVDIVIGFCGLLLLELNREIIYVSFQCYYFLILLLIFSDWISFISIIMFCSFFYYYSYCIYECLIYFSICFIILMLLLSLISILSLYYLIFLNIQSLEQPSLVGFSYHLFIILLHFYHIIFSLYLLIFLCNFIICYVLSTSVIFNAFGISSNTLACLDLNISIKLLEIYFHLIELFYIYLFTLIN